MGLLGARPARRFGRGRLPQLAAAGILAIALAGCGTTWYHPTKRADAFQGDLYGCERDAAGMQDVLRWRMMIERCLAVQGWQQ
jgi:hypothetical protein